ncbi:MAG: ABC transporter ATP-binding protein [Acidothermus cellulolyticus]|nr:ABC transporter ATP-binding protein [Acidothermus cellulolyticus]
MSSEDPLSRLITDPRRGVAAVEMQGISKRFGNVQALDGASLTVQRGEVHALLGENGAGKTTLMNVLSGIYHADRGSIYVHGEKIEIHSPRSAVLHCVGMVHQTPELIDAFTGYENLSLAKTESHVLGAFNRGREELESLAERYGLPVDLRRRVRDLAMGERQKLEILRELYRGATILILDEPTTHLTPGEFDSLFSVIRLLAESGMSVIFISHKLHEVLAVADQITVLRKGRTVGSRRRAEVTRDELVEMMLGSVSDPEASELALSIVSRAFGTRSSHRPLPAHGAPQDHLGSADAYNLLRLTNVSVRAGQRRLEVNSLTVNRGEIVGVAGVAGNGQRELVDLLAGTLPVRSGSISLDGRDITAMPVAERLRRGLAVIPEDPLNEGALPTLPLWQTFILGLHQIDRRSRWDIRRLKQQTQKMIEQFGLAASGPDAITGTLSGGTLQRAIVARSLRILSGSHGGLLVAFNPTQGLDIAGIAFVRSYLRELAKSRSGVLLISEDLDELFDLSDRMYVLFSGEITSHYDRSEFDLYRIGASMVGVRHD